ncbi:GcrA family cell cycle regulator [Streptomyces sampsonii]|uniref:GcrA family cell cycle regulator n=1 Tax=Streptomyces sampsonii TaxID=42239 RepID=UPI0008F49B41
MADRAQISETYPLAPKLRRKPALGWPGVSPEEILRREWAAGTSSEDIARLLGVARSAVSNRVRRLGLPSRRPRVSGTLAPGVSPEEILRREWAAGTSTEDIARLLGAAKSTVSNRVRRVGLPSRRPRVSRKGVSRKPALGWQGVSPAEILRREWAAGTSTEDIARLLGAAKSTVSNRVRRLGLPSRRPRVSRKGVSRKPALGWQGVSPEEILRREWAAGTSTEDIARLLGVARSTVSTQRRRLGLPSRLRPRVSRETAAAIGRERRAGTAQAEIARRLGVELHVVKGQLKTLGLSREREGWSAEAKAAMRREWEAGTPGPEIARQLGITPKAVYRLRRTMGLPPRRAGTE